MKYNRDTFQAYDTQNQSQSRDTVSLALCLMNARGGRTDADGRIAGGRAQTASQSVGGGGGCDPLPRSLCLSVHRGRARFGLATASPRPRPAAQQHRECSVQVGRGFLDPEKRRRSERESLISNLTADLPD